MKRLIKILPLAVVLLAYACSDWTDTDPIYSKTTDWGNQTSDEYYAALREWKSRPDVPKAFCWFDQWTAGSISNLGRLSSLPDSVAMVSIWGAKWPLSDALREDKEYSQKVKGTKVLACFIAADVGDQMTPADYIESWEENGFASEKDAINNYWGLTDLNDDVIYEAAVRRYAKAIVDSVNKYDYDGFDWDLEPNFAGGGQSSKTLWYLSKTRNWFIDELAKHLGPTSGTNKILAVDGEPYLLTEHGHAIDYFLIQAYNSDGYSDMDGRLNRLFTNLKNEHMDELEIARRTIWTENFETYANWGGSSYGATERNKEGRVPSIIAMANYTREIDGKEVQTGGCGMFRSSFDYYHTGALFDWEDQLASETYVDYFYFRRAIRCMYQTYDRLNGK